MAILTERVGRVLIVVISRFESRNAVDPEHADALHDAFVAFESDEASDVAILYGEGGAFCAGADLKRLAKRQATGPDRGLDFPGPGLKVPRAPMGPTRLTLSKPVIAAIEGPAVAGGMELALWADCRVMATGSYMGVYNRRWGLPLSDGGTVRLPRLIGQGRALEIILTGRKIDAEECLHIGLCERVVPKGNAREAAEQMALQVAQFPQVCLRADLRACRLQHGLSERTALEMEWSNCKGIFNQEGARGATKFALGAGRHGDPIETLSDPARSSGVQRGSRPLHPRPA